MTQAAFDFAGSRQVHKRQRQTARAVYHALATSLRGREAQVLRGLTAYWDAEQQSPTALELLAWMRQHGESLFDINSLRPRITALVQRGAVEPRQARCCRVSGRVVHTWAIREIGSACPR